MLDAHTAEGAMGKAREQKAGYKRAANLSIDAELLASAKEAGINLSATLEDRLREILREREREKWRAENREAIEAYNERVDREGVIRMGRRRF
jgi:antitoxin CcdA